MRAAFKEAVMEREPVVIYGFKSFFSACSLANQFPVCSLYLYFVIYPWFHELLLMDNFCLITPIDVLLKTEELNQCKSKFLDTEHSSCICVQVTSGIISFRLATTRLNLKEFIIMNCYCLFISDSGRRKFEP